MAEFETLQPGDVVVGRGRTAAATRQPYIDAVKAGDAGRIKLGEGEKPATARRLLQEAAKVANKKVRAAYEESEGALYWKAVS